MNGHNNPKDSKDYYKILNLKPSATEADIKAAYKKLALTTHPDKFPVEQHEEATAKFIEIKEAFDVLSDPAKKSAYDISISSKALNAGGSPARFASFAREHQADIKQSDDKLKTSQDPLATSSDDTYFYVNTMAKMNNETDRQKIVSTIAKWKSAENKPAVIRNALGGPLGISEFKTYDEAVKHFDNVDAAKKRSGYILRIPTKDITDKSVKWVKPFAIESFLYPNPQFKPKEGPKKQ